MSELSLRRLIKNHGIITRIIARNQRSRGFDQSKLRELKKVRLSIKDKIALLKASSPRQESAR